MTTINVFCEQELLTTLYLNSVPPFKKGETFYYSPFLQGIEKYTIERIDYNVQYTSKDKNFLIVELFVK